MDRPTERPLLQQLVLNLSAGGNDGKQRPARNLAIVADVGVREPRVFIILLLWYFFSGTTLFLNKFVLNAVTDGASLLGIAQVLITTCCSFIQLYYPCGMWKLSKQSQPKPPKFRRTVLVVGVFRFLTIYFGLVALDYVAVSFAETVKCSAPIFTVFISWMITAEPATAQVILSLVPIMGGLALCSAHELSFNLPGFTAALITNVSECFQSVYSKVLVSGEKFRCNPAELQFYSGAASLILIIPTSYFIPWETVSLGVNPLIVGYFLINGISFHLQSITANVLMGFLSPTTYSVSNTVKRALLIWISTLVFGNPVTVGAWIGSAFMIAGILLYNQAKTEVVKSVTAAD
ncbi:Solute carrier family 35 member E2B [Hypsibius exemplaris]|uniref:Solute carrier family 35 member E2B n=1 Tax=Hypsibius exemplaris TaxID=2072580 RepID=A0A1W0WF56_HYPEX|nr:Solute carrier family 35 member E2B [Hypsibius exemplaris]